MLQHVCARIYYVELNIRFSVDQFRLIWTACPSMVLASHKDQQADLEPLALALPSARTERATISKPIRLRSDIFYSLSAVTISSAEQSLLRVFTQSQKILVLRSFF